MAATRTIQIVLVEDDHDYAALVAAELSAAWPGELAVVHAERLEDARPLLEAVPDCVLLDLSLPDAHGLDGLRDALDLAGQAPVVVLTGQGEENGLAGAALRLGAQDYLVKSRAPGDVIARSVRYAMERRGAERERRRLAAGYAREARIAEELQRGLIRPLPEVAGLELAARYEPSSSAERVGGDWYDVVRLPGGLLGLAMGDVAGHGLPAAALMGELSSALRAAALAGPDPARAVETVDVFLRHFYPGEIATLAWAVLDPADPARPLRVASAGHPPPLVLRAGGATEWIEAGRMALLGGPPGAEREPPAEVALGPGDTLLLYTDGLVERRREPIDTGLARLAAAAAEVVAEGPRALTDHVLEALVSPTGGDDDVALLAVRRAS